MRLEARDLKAGYGDTFAVEVAELVLQERSVTGLVGPNGAGKSTLLKVLSRTMKPERGVVLLDGESIHKLPTRLVARKMAFVGHNLDGLLELTVDELVQRGRYPHQTAFKRDTAEDRESVEWALGAMRLGPLRRRTLKHLSHGELRRAWTAVALAQRPDILLLDEPTAFLDIAHQLELLALLYELKDHGVTVLMSMHDLLLTSLYCQRVIVVQDGRIAAHGPTEEVLTTELVREIFGVEAEYRDDAASGRRLLVPVMVTRREPPSNGHADGHPLSSREAEPSPH